jgi:hypothetical protein
MKRSNTISYEMDNQSAVYAYYSQLNSWMHLYEPYSLMPQLAPQYCVQEEQVNEEMKMSS